jgi:hypothetical protein
MKPSILCMALLSAILLFAGCRGIPPRGLVYNHTLQPLDMNHRMTQREKARDRGDIKRFSYSVADVAWDSNAIGDIAKRNGFDVVYYADSERFSILGIWNQYTVHVYGK